ncbi:pyrimidine dimer DNA glycosylase/endonuclease V [Arcanobacterium buesumense]|uniref:DNA lyase n=1 Tax=Arcanobacterium buesumense TaxID=2722751 RepID=A0A6H2EKJ6_9ACTO|nr:pyrimidine dimer DNA glycosylase/endonuclease V [Arcanobacterium buesumense]QJC21419.1 DNA lyase [Arcanobacterium buesumense]
MRLWSLDPSHLDRAALVAGWREGLLAQKVLAGLTKGYQHHPQLERFRAQDDPMAAIGAWLAGLHEDATRRGYAFDATKITFPPRVITNIQVPVTSGQLAYEAQWLRAKIERRAPQLLHHEPWVSGKFRTHPIFVLTAGDVEGWERNSKDENPCGLFDDR